MERIQKKEEEAAKAKGGRRRRRQARPARPSDGASRRPRPGRRKQQPSAQEESRAATVGGGDGAQDDELKERQANNKSLQPPLTSDPNHRPLGAKKWIVVFIVIVDLPESIILFFLLGASLMSPGVKRSTSKIANLHLGRALAAAAVQAPYFENSALAAAQNSSGL